MQEELRKTKQTKPNQTKHKGYNLSINCVKSIIPVPQILVSEEIKGKETPRRSQQGENLKCILPK